MSARIVVTAETVRVWARSKGMEVAEHGRLSAEVINAYNKGRKATYESTMAQPALPLRIEGLKADKAGRNRKVIYTVTIPELRAWAGENGFSIGARGRIPAEVKAAFANREAAPVKVKANA